MEFLVEFDVNVPPDAPAGEVERRMAAEAAAAAVLGEKGILVRLWKPATQPAQATAIGVYRADSAAQLSDLLRALPLADWMQTTVTALEPHPNDPTVNARGFEAVRDR